MPPPALDEESVDKAIAQPSSEYPKRELVSMLYPDRRFCSNRVLLTRFHQNFPPKLAQALLALNVALPFVLCIFLWHQSRAGSVTWSSQLFAELATLCTQQSVILEVAWLGLCQKMSKEAFGDRVEAQTRTRMFVARLPSTRPRLTT